MSTSVNTPAATSGALLLARGTSTPKLCQSLQFLRNHTRAFPMKHALMVSLNIRREATQIFNKSDREVCMNNGTIIKLRWLGGVLFTLFLISACVTNPTQRHALTVNDLEYF